MHSRIEPVLRIGGRLGPGARNHCVHGRNELIVAEVLDIKPFEYYTADHHRRDSTLALRLTFQFSPAPDGGTHLRLFACCRSRFLPRWVARRITDYILNKNFRPLWALDQIDALIRSAPGQPRADRVVAQIPQSENAGRSGGRPCGFQKTMGSVI